MLLSNGNDIAVAGADSQRLVCNPTVRWCLKFESESQVLVLHTTESEKSKSKKVKGEHDTLYWGPRRDGRKHFLRLSFPTPIVTYAIFNYQSTS